ncbi:MAG TPA: mannose-1-phosphate guanylyltransferase [Thermodesulfobacteriota bacterium]|nr:mannose-1-phosphate guanylyltransferase [Thermodesulfobacteriota bacterium]
MFAVIMAGGQGTRFWPRSRRKRPKQLLDIVGPESMIRQTVDRLDPLIKPEDVYVVTGKEHIEELIGHIPYVPSENIIAEPIGRNTAPCIGLAAMRLRKIDPEGIMAVLPADHVILDKEAFIETLRFAGDVAKNSDYIITLGMKPDRPETGYGYIKMSSEFRVQSSEFKSVGAYGHTPFPVYHVERFVEKPDMKTAEGYVKSGEYLWNAGMFIFKVSTILRAIEKYMPDLYIGLLRMEPALGTDSQEKVLSEVYGELPSVSIDYGVMEKADNVLVVPSTFGWNDVGSWTAIDDLLPRDEHGVVAHAEHISIDTKDCIIYSPKKLVATIGVSDLIVVETEDALLICHKSRAQDVKKVVEILEKEGKGKYL